MIRQYSYLNPRPEKTCAVLRYGGLGDSMQVSSILPYLKDEGYHITVYTVPTAWEVIKHDPHIDAVVLQDVDAIHNPDLGDFWAYTAKKYDRFINLSESIERSLLAMPGNTNHGWSQKMRHKYLNHNYMQFIHDIAGVPMPPKMRFYPTEEETRWAHEQRAGARGPVILWVLSGSAVHKVWPHMDFVIDHFLKKNPHTSFVLVGDASCKRLEEGWEGVRQVHRKSGEWSIRETMAFSQVADLVVGPETGVLNAVAFDDIPKIVLLSHSSGNNLTRDWVNCTSLSAKNTPCYPCHQIHFSFAHCVQHQKDSGIAACQFDVPAAEMIRAIERAL